MFLEVRVLCLALSLEDSTASFLEKGHSEVTTVSLSFQQHASSSLASALRQLAFDVC